MEHPPIKMTYRELVVLDPMLMQKLSMTPTHNAKASHIRHVLKQVNAAKAKMSDEWKDMGKKYGKHDDKGELIRAENHAGFELKEGVEKEFEDAVAVFDKTECEIKWRPLTPDTLADIKMTARDMEILGPLFSDENGPGVPQGFQPQLMK